MSSNGISTHTPKSERRGLKMALASTKRQTSNTNGYRQYNVYESPGTVAPTVGRPWLLYPTVGVTTSYLTAENGNPLMTETNDNLII